MLLALLAPQGTLLLLLRAVPTLDLILRSAAWPPDRALRHMEAGRGSHFDPECLDAFLAVMAERGYRPGHGEGDGAVADAAAEACHDHPQAADLAATHPCRANAEASHSDV